MAAPVIDIYQQLTILLALATLSHFTFKRFRQPTILGEIMIGVVLGPSLLGALNIITFDPTFVAIFANIGAIFLLFLIGLESDFRALYTSRNVLVAIGGVTLPLVAGFFFAYFLLPPGLSLGPVGTQFTMAMFIGAALVATSTAIAASILREMGLVQDRVAQTIMGAAVIDDVLGLLVLSIVVGMSRGAVNPIDIGVLMATAAAFIIVGVIVGIRFFSRAVVAIQIAGLRLGLRHGGFLIALAITFLYAFVAETIGLSAIVGAFLAGTMFAATPLRDEFSLGAGYLGALFTPIFFISLGLAVNIFAVTSGLVAFAVIIVLVAIASKFAGCVLAARLAKMSAKESVAVGWGMTPRGEVGLIVAVTALTAGIISNGLFSTMVVVLIAVSMVPAPLFRRAMIAVTRERETVAAVEVPETTGAS